MCGIILHKDGVYNFYSKMCDAPLYEPGLTLDQVIQITREEEGARGLQELPDRIKRAQQYGTSARGVRGTQSLEERIQNNRAGDHEANLSYDEFVGQFLTLPEQEIVHETEKKGADDLLEMMYQASFQGDIREVQSIYVQYLQNKFDDGIQRYSGEQFMTLIDKGLDINYQSSPGKETALMQVVYKHDAEYAKLFLEMGANINLQDKYGYSALIHLVLNTHLYANDLSQVERDLALENAKKVLPILLEYQPNLDLIDEEGKTVIEYYQDECHPELTRMLIEYHKMSEIVLK